MQISNQNFKVLLVEDNKSVANIHVKMLKEVGCVVDVAQDGRAALFMGQEKYDLIFMDLGLPYIEGIDVCIQLRQIEKDKNAKRKPIVGLTAYDLNNVEAECLAAGMDTVINKPTSPKILEKVINTYARR
jgi:CheY-like chemotaxis protein